ncbi:MAG TPA: hypothetical protein VFW45_16910 [Candidatus Polarisedimenticolia bacterium]|nr:hypothetical protein [Candidatus Polarisedimenticolia bacterium]
MTANTPRYVALIVGFSVIQAIGTTRAAPEKIPNDKVIHPLMKGVAEPQLIPGSRINPVYPEQWLKHHLGAVVILQGVVEKSGSVRELAPLKTDLRVEEGCSKEPVDSKDKQGVPPKAARDFEIAALKAVKQWKYRPAEMNDMPVEVFYTMIVEFTSCPVEPGKQLP